jgi:hypothetical protein
VEHDRDSPDAKEGLPKRAHPMVVLVGVPLCVRKSGR